ncbi:hypothetical protein LC087_09890 [Bacillus carboniphilus]|uniref:Uncharacterized protein n=1 Tax=Bacillus carboniphilus TaxID=86663 RepID=A0ABY9JSA3_9BACI|nr:hypothetical protein [Bacillus carboniphilus]WLR41252.1 hypothetical protein LC087_09890 [Bacillus carboniphilus]
MINLIYGLFLYFPEDKREYIPAFITMAVFIIFAFITFLWIIRMSKKEQKETETKYKEKLPEK